MKTGIAFGLMLLALGAMPARAQAPYEIHVIEALSGGGAFLGQAEGQALAQFEKAINKNGGIQGRPLKFVYHDDQTNPQTAVQLANDILATKPAVVLVSSVVAVCNAVAPLFQENGPVMYCFAPGIHPAPGSYAYSMNTSTLDLAAASIRYWRMRGVKRLAIITSTDGSGQDAEKALLAAVGNPGIKASFRSSPTSISILRTSRWRRRSKTSRRPSRNCSSPGAPARPSRQCSARCSRPASMCRWRPPTAT